MLHSKTVRPISASITLDHPDVLQFWEIYHRINTFAEGVNHSKDSAIIAVDPIEFCIRSSNLGYELPFICELKEKLRTSKHYRFIEIKNIVSAITLKPKKCWLFAKPMLPPTNSMALSVRVLPC